MELFEVVERICQGFPFCFSQIVFKSQSPIVVAFLFVTAVGFVQGQVSAGCRFFAFCSERPVVIEVDVVGRSQVVPFA